MPIDYIIHKDRRLVITTMVGHVTFAEFQAYHNRLLNDPAFDPKFNQLMDATGITQADLTIEEGKAITERKTFASTSRRAFVATSRDAIGLIRLSQNHLSKLGTASLIRLFSDVPSAVKWLHGVRKSDEGNT